jgi:shikimate kinase
VAAIFADEGEAGFRARECTALKRVAALPRTVIATGGGTLTSAENRELIRTSGRSIFLDAPLDVLFERVERSSRARPLFLDREQARALYERRVPIYRSADVIVPVGLDDRPEAVAQRLAAELGREPCAT